MPESIGNNIWAVLALVVAVIALRFAGIAVIQLLARRREEREALRRAKRLNDEHQPRG